MPDFNFIDLVNGAGGGALENLTSTAYSQVWQTVGEKITADSMRVCGEYTASTPAAGAFTAEATFDVCTKNAHGFQTGLLVQVSTSNTLPSPLQASTNYYVIRIDANTFYLASSYANAIAGSHINIASAGTGTQTITPTTLSATVSLEFSNDVVQGENPATWFTEPNCTQAVTADGDFVFDVDYTRAAAWRLAASIASGQVSFTSAQALLKQG